MKKMGFALSKAEGYTLLEMLLVIALTGGIVAVVGASYVQIIKGRVGIPQKSVAMADMDSSIHWLTRDLVLAQTTNLTDGALPASGVNLNWSDLTQEAVDTGTIAHSANYTFSGTQLLRNYDGNISIVGRHVTRFGISIRGTMFTVNLTSSYGFPGSPVTRSFNIDERSAASP